MKKIQWGKKQSQKNNRKILKIQQEKHQEKTAVGKKQMQKQQENNENTLGKNNRKIMKIQQKKT